MKCIASVTAFYLWMSPAREREVQTAEILFAYSGHIFLFAVAAGMKCLLWVTLGCSYSETYCSAPQGVFFIAAPDVKRSLVLVMNEIAFPGIIHVRAAHPGSEMHRDADLPWLGLETCDKGNARMHGVWHSLLIPSVLHASDLMTFIENKTFRVL